MYAIVLGEGSFYVIKGFILKHNIFHFPCKKISVHFKGGFLVKKRVLKGTEGNIWT
jgi:hypothetical protein